MIQRIDLYRDELRPREPSVELARNLLLIGAALLLVLVLGAVQQWFAASSGRSLAALQAEQAELQSRIAAASEQLARRTPDPAITAALIEAQNALDGRRWLVDQLAAAGQQSKSFAELMEGAGRRRVEPVWLTRLRVAEGGAALGFGGRTVSPEAVPGFLERLAEEPAFKGSEFTHFRMERPEKAGDPMLFDLATACVALAAGCEDPTDPGARR